MSMKQLWEKKLIRVDILRCISTHICINPLPTDFFSHICPWHHLAITLTHLNLKCWLNIWGKFLSDQFKPCFFLVRNSSHLIWGMRKKQNLNNKKHYLNSLIYFYFWIQFVYLLLYSSVARQLPLRYSNVCVPF